MKKLGIIILGDLDEMYRNIKSSIQGAAEETLSTQIKKQSKKLWWNKEAEELVQKKETILSNLVEKQKWGK